MYRSKKIWAKTIPALVTAGVMAIVLSLSAAQAETASPNSFRRGMTAYNLGEFSEAARIWSRLAEQGSGNAQSGLGLLYYTGSGVPRDFGHAHKLFLAAAKKIIPEALMFLSLMYRRGDGVPQSYLMSYMWCDLAVGVGHEGASYVRPLIAEHLSAKNVLKAQQLAAAWRNHNFR
jgi:TPR repeat protein